MNRKELSGIALHFCGVIIEIVLYKYIPVVFAIDYKNKTYRLEA
jgi:hypothetical protein